MGETPKVRIEFEPLNRWATVEPNTTLLEAARAAGVEMVSLCGGVGNCESCEVQLLQGRLSPPNAAELSIFSEADLAQGLRLACQATPATDVRLLIPPSSLDQSQRLQLEAGMPMARPATVVPGPRLRLGLAVDLGTSKLAGYLVDLETGETLATAGAMNPQVRFGEDVISRIAYAGSRLGGAGELREAALQALEGILDELCSTAGVARSQIVEAAIVGNTAMHHLLLGLPVSQLGAAPYMPAEAQARDLSPEQIGLDLEPGARVHLPPLLAGFVGSDHLAVLLATGLWRTEHTAAAIDIGTNTEISLAHRGRLLSCSCASGPALEGAHIRHGMRAGPGAIERVRIEGGVVRVHTIAGAPAKGICGSGLVDAVAEMRAAGILDARGAADPRAPGVRPGTGGHAWEFVLVAGRDGLQGQDIVLTASDIRQLQLAKGAIRAGLQVLAQEAGVREEELEQVEVAGAFGSYLNIRSAVRLGMLPPLPRARFRQVGNAAGLGARQLLTSAELRAAEGEVVRRMRYVELATHPGFVPAFVQAMQL
jgi:uncharacterized 2Fe-2S/4Fe-4S cluster protein (DUF4445 family)